MRNCANWLTKAAETAAYMTVTHPDYAILAARIAVSNLHKQTKKQFSQVVSDLYHYVNPVSCWTSSILLLVKLILDRKMAAPRP